MTEPPAQDADGVDLADLGASVPLPDPEAQRAARERCGPGAGSGGLGRLAELAGWAAGVTGRCPPRPFRTVRLVLVGAPPGAAGDRGSQGTQPAAVREGTASVDVLAREAGAGLRALEPGGDAGGSVAAGLRALDAEVDGGTDLLLPVLAAPALPAVAVVGAALLGREPVEVVDRRGGLSDADWARTTTAVRDGLRRTKGLTADPLGLLATAGDASLAFLTGLCLGAAVRRTPVLLDGPATAVAALVAQRLAPRAPLWYLAGSRSGDPLHDLALARLDLEPLLDLGVRQDGVAALVALPVLQAALAVATGDDQAPTEHG